MSIALTASDELERPATRDAKSNVSNAIENYGLSAALLLLILLPIAEIVLRRAFAIGISGSTTIVQHLTLVISMLGAAVAARESRLLSLATTTFLAPRLRRVAAVISGAVAA